MCVRVRECTGHVCVCARASVYGMCVCARASVQGMCVCARASVYGMCMCARASVQGPMFVGFFHRTPFGQRPKGVLLGFFWGSFGLLGKRGSFGVLLARGLLLVFGPRAHSWGNLADGFRV